MKDEDQTLLTALGDQIQEEVSRAGIEIIGFVLYAQRDDECGAEFRARMPREDFVKMVRESVEGE
jgi:hypothetical protein